jgi:integrase/recombinase XerD
MLRCGLRVSEVSSLTFQAIDFQAKTIRINNSKGQVDRIVYLSPDLEKSLHLYQQIQPKEATYLFASPSNKAKPLSISRIQRLMKKYLKLAQLIKPYSPHWLRHTFATQLLNAGTPLEVVKELMGHRSITMTLRYTQLYDQTKRTQYDQAMQRIENLQTHLGR